jgi:hypothetical protein
MFWRALVQGCVYVMHCRHVLASPAADRFATGVTNSTLRKWLDGPRSTLKFFVSQQKRHVCLTEIPFPPIQYLYLLPTKIPLLGPIPR